MPAVKNNAKANSQISKKKKIIFKLTAIAMPFLLLALLEGTLRLFSYGHNLPLFVTDESCPDCLVMNKYVSERYFTNAANATIGNFEPFKIKKSKGTIRLFVLGESTTIGYPYMHNGAFHRWLKYRLMQMYPDVDFEIINLSLTAVNSYTVLDMAKELDQYEPDAVLIYSGHNEYYGALGIGSTSKLGNQRWVIQSLISLKKLRVVQLAFNTLSTVGRLTGAKGDSVNKSLMERMAADQRIAYQSVKFKTGITQFARNINAACSLLSAKKIPVLISNLVSNEKDLPPFISDRDPSNGAGITYQKGMEAYLKKDSLKARQLFIKAKDQDMLRFRAPEQMDSVITAATKRYPGVYLVDTKKAFESRSVYGILDNSTLLEHVHPNLWGYSLMSEAFFQSLTAHRVIAAKPVTSISVKQLWQQMPITKVDSLFGAYSIAFLKKGWPFNNKKIADPYPRTPEELIAMHMLKNGLPWNDAMDQLMSFYQQKNDKRAMLKVAEAVMLEYPYDPAFYLFAGQLSAADGDNFKAINYWHRAFIIKSSIALAQKLFVLEVKVNCPEKAIDYIDYALKNNPGNGMLLSVRKKLTAIIGINNALKKDPANNLLKEQLKKNYANLENRGN
ncbi:hypothetical protein SNE25_20015 [Mucilaginibacter sabulilitoris]|uniref:SGNH hydrolase-type esterase domain-containing protein n=1 Tax=Mucilaginibacter sabulilitoris TaxID=1173583 RepID=A0ABZ0TFM0_9SPHI|nr:hypothetical protein [Mucilaginibacter sabulilitoris]WPU91606.1 hypothetical protein SNE25_20015 [Mucilaginibacter sabulilitoris]